MPSDKLDVSIKDIVFERDFRKELAKELTKLNYAQAFMWLGIKFVNDGVERITAQELSDEVWGGKDASYCLKILKRFNKLNVIKSERKQGKKVRYFMSTGHKIFGEFKHIAMQTIQSAREEKDEKNEE